MPICFLPKTQQYNRLVLQKKSWLQLKLLREHQYDCILTWFSLSDVELPDVEVLRQTQQMCLLGVGCSDGNRRQASAYAVSRGQRG